MVGSCFFVSIRIFDLKVDIRFDIGTLKSVFVNTPNLTQSADVAYFFFRKTEKGDERQKACA